MFVDTSSLFKKYAEEPGSDAFEGLLSQATEIAVSPVTWVEMNAAIGRRLRARSLSIKQAEWLSVEAKKDYAYFLQVLWNENLENKAVELVRRHALRTMDAVQLASGILSESTLFVTSDRKLYLEAKKVIRRVRYV
ncbi:MAG: type II toxin-antitoxin system VapC family toxin [Candidatus Omnitrophica bacterium]|nr:type II toxin-antitoxin system VapC family toxin [Candidatus Omnitrophota bacterium]